MNLKYECFRNQHPTSRLMSCQHQFFTEFCPAAPYPRHPSTKPSLGSLRGPCPLRWTVEICCGGLTVGNDVPRVGGPRWLHFRKVNSADVNRVFCIPLCLHTTYVLRFGGLLDLQCSSGMSSELPFVCLLTIDNARSLQFISLSFSVLAISNF